MNRGIIVSFVGIAVCAIAVATWWKPGEPTAPAPATPELPNIEVPQGSHPPPTAEAAGVHVIQAPAAAGRSIAEPTSQSASGPEDPLGGKPITIETLTGCKHVQQVENAQLIIEFASNGEWKVNGNVRAQWTIEDGSVKVYDDKGEVHYIDIIGNKLVYNGREVELTR